MTWPTANPDWIAKRFGAKSRGSKVRTCVELDIDRQSVTASGSPSDIDSLIRAEVEALGGREGRLTMIFGLYPGVPPQNVAAIMNAMERYAFYY